jgi:hypothetical protein
MWIVVGWSAAVDAGDGTTRDVIQVPYRLSDAAARVRGPTRERGHDNCAVLLDRLELDDAGIDEIAD